MEYNTTKYAFIYKGVEQIELNCIEDTEITKINITVNFGKSVKPEPIDISWRTSGNGIFGMWSPLDSRGEIKPNWNPVCTESRAALGMPYQCYMDNSDMNCVSVYISDARTPITISSGVVEETGELEWRVTLFSEKTGMMERYNTQLVIDERKISFEESIASAADCWNTTEGFSQNVIPKSAFDGVYSTWYSYHQNVTEEALLSELGYAAKLGLKTVIIDDGWQTEDNSRGYAYCGDWNAAASKIPDMAEFADKVHKIGMKIMLWYSVPFVGEHSEAKKYFKNQFLGEIDEESRAYVLDPRYPMVREYLVKIYESAVRDWHLDGLKLDFIDFFKLTEKSESGDANMDTESLEEGICILLNETKKRLKAINKDVLIEFRQKYIGPVMMNCGNMLRAADCPMDAFTNRVSTMNLRLTSADLAVHSDMLMWNYDDEVETAALQLINVLFSVPQISMRIGELSMEHYKMLEFYLNLQRHNMDVIMNGKLKVKAPCMGYESAAATKDGNTFAVMYSSEVFKINQKCKRAVVVNATGNDFIYADLSAVEASGYTACNCMGVETENAQLTQGIFKINVPKSGVVIFENIC